MPQQELSPQQLQSLMSKYRIVFEGPIGSEEWPPGYGDIFQEIRNIGSIKFGTYAQNFAPDFLPLAERKIRIRELVRSASRCLEDMANEAEWREETEVKVFARFNSEVVW